MKLHTMLNSIGIGNINVKDFDVRSILPPQYASTNDISYIDDRHMIYADDCNAGAIFMDKKYQDMQFKKNNIIFVDEPYLLFARLTQFFKSKQIEKVQSNIAERHNVTIYDGVFIGNNVSIGNGSMIMPGVVICDNVSIGENTTIYPNVTIYKDSVIGNRVTIHAGSVIGSDGFGYAHTKTGEHVKIEHIGNVIIEDDVEIGSNTTIDRAVLDSTIIKRGAKIDNLVQIGHNCVIGEYTILVSQVGFAGSTTTGRNVVCGGQVGTGGHVHIGDFTQIAGRGAVSKNLPPNTKWAGHPIQELKSWQKLQVKLKKMMKE